MPTPKFGHGSRFIYIGSHLTLHVKAYPKIGQNTQNKWNSSYLTDELVVIFFIESFDDKKMSSFQKQPIITLSKKKG